MDYKKLYEETIEKVKGLIEKRRNGGLYVVPIKDIEDSIPELKESEDERIRKELIEQVVYIIPNDNEVDSEGNILPTHQKRIDKYRAWLEKQDEKKHTDIVKPKFHEGEWVVFNDKHESVYQIEKIENFQYTLRHVLGGSMPLSFGYEDMIRAWTIADAKDGDVLYDGNAACIFRKTMEDDDAIWIDTYCGINIDNEFKVNDEYECWCISSECSPATKEQRDLLFQKMHEKGYEWDAEHKQLKKIEQKPINKIEPKFKVGDKIQYLKGCGTIMTIEKIENGEYIFGNNLGHTTIESGNKWHLVNLIEQTPSWGEEDETMTTNIIIMLKEGASLHFNKKDIAKGVDWLKSIKDKVGCEVNCTITKEWSEENKYNHNIILCLLNNECVGREDKRIAIEWFKSLRPQNQQESIEDKVNNFFDALGDCGYMQDEILRLKSIWKQAGLPQPQNHWKPTEDQMKELRKYSDNVVLRNLYYNLKKLQS